MIAPLNEQLNQTHRIEKAVPHVASQIRKLAQIFNKVDAIEGIWIQKFGNGKNVLVRQLSETAACLKNIANGVEQDEAARKGLTKVLQVGQNNVYGLVEPTELTETKYLGKIDGTLVAVGLCIL